MPPTSTAARAGGFDATLQRARRVQAGELTRRYDIHTILFNIARFAKNAFFVFLSTRLARAHSAEQDCLSNLRGRKTTRASWSNAPSRFNMVGCWPLQVSFFRLNFIAGQNTIGYMCMTRYFAKCSREATESASLQPRTSLPPFCSAHFPFIGRPEFRRVKTPDVYGQ